MTGLDDQRQCVLIDLDPVSFRRATGTRFSIAVSVTPDAASGLVTRPRAYPRIAVSPHASPDIRIQPMGVDQKAGVDLAAVVMPWHEGTRPRDGLHPRLGFFTSLRMMIYDVQCRPFIFILFDPFFFLFSLFFFLFFPAADIMC